MSDATHAPLTSTAESAGDDSEPRACSACGKVGERVSLGMTLEERQTLQKVLVEARARRKARHSQRVGRKRKASALVSEGNERGVEPVKLSQVADASVTGRTATTWTH